MCKKKAFKFKFIEKFVEKNLKFKIGLYNNLIAKHFYHNKDNFSIYYIILLLINYKIQILI